MTRRRLSPATVALPCVSAALVVLLPSPPATACPGGLHRCLATDISQGGGAVAPATRAPLLFTVAARAAATERTEPIVYDLDPVEIDLRVDLDAPRAGPAEPEVPWIWQVLTREVYDRLPRVAEHDTYTAVLAPVVLTTSSEESEPGVGLRGDF